MLVCIFVPRGRGARESSLYGPQRYAQAFRVAQNVGPAHGLIQPCKAFRRAVVLGHGTAMLLGPKGRALAHPAASEARRIDPCTELAIYVSGEAAGEGLLSFPSRRVLAGRCAMLFGGDDKRPSPAALVCRPRTREKMSDCPRLGAEGILQCAVLFFVSGEWEVPEVHLCRGVDPAGNQDRAATWAQRTYIRQGRHG